MKVAIIAREGYDSLEGNLQESFRFLGHHPHIFHLVQIKPFFYKHCRRINCQSHFDIHLKTYGDNRLNMPHGWTSGQMTFLANKVIASTDTGQHYEKTLEADSK